MESRSLIDSPPKFKSKVWNFFGFRNSVDADKTTCKLCFIDISYKHGNTTNMTAHLKRKHGVSPTEPEKTNAKQSVTSPPSTGSSGQQTLGNIMKSKLSHTNTRHKSITQAIAGFIAYDMRPYSFVSNEGFKYLLNILEPRYTVPSRTHFSETVLPALSESVKKHVVAELKYATSISITTDSWTSRATENYLAVTAHFINKEWEVANYTLETLHFTESHTAENLAMSLLSTVKQWDLVRNGCGPALSTDNASNIVKAVKIAGVYPHIPCFAHTLNLATQKGLSVKEVERLLGRVRRIVGFFHRSTTACAVLKSKQALLKIPQHKLIIDVSTRWNSSFDMAEHYLEQQAAVFAALLTAEVKKNLKDIVTPSDKDVKDLENVVEVLRPIKTITTIMCNKKHPTVSLIHPLKELLLKQLAVRPDDGSLVKAIKQAIHADLSPRYSDSELLEYLLLSSALDPRFRSLPYLDENSRHNVYHSVSLKAAKFETVPPIAGIVVKQEKVDDSSTSGQQENPHQKPECLQHDLDEDDHIQGQDMNHETDCDEPQAKVPKSALDSLFGDVFITYVQPARSVYDMVDAEMSNYRAEPIPPLNADPLLWWKAREGTYPILSKLAASILCVPATSVASERVFSTAGDIVNAQRASLSSDNVNILIFLKRNLKIPSDLMS